MGIYDICVSVNRVSLLLGWFAESSQENTAASSIDGNRSSREEYYTRKLC